MAEKEVYFERYCPLCIYSSYPETVEPCDDCIAQSVNEDSHKPLYFKKRTKSTSQK